MACPACEAFAQMVQRHYAYLFTELEFRLVHCEDGQPGRRCLLAAESGRARIKFELDGEAPLAYFGTLDSPIGWANQLDGVPVWYLDNALLNFVEGAPSGSGPASAAGTARGLEQLMAAAAARLRPLAAELVAAFAPDRTIEWWRDFDADQARRRQHLRQGFTNH